MKIPGYSLIFFCISTLFFSSCKNDLKLNAPYKEIPSIYAVLNPYEKVQMIRVNKVFLGEGDANQMAKVSDSINYQPDEITVTLERYVNGKKTKVSPNSADSVIVFSESMVTTEAGAFNTNQRVYISSDSLFVDGEYHLKVRDNHTGNIFTAKANPIQRVNPNQGYGPLSPPYAPYAPGVTSGFINYYANSPTVSVGSVLFQPVNGGKIYEMVIRSDFYNDLGSGRRSYDYVDYTFNNTATTRVLSGTTYISVTFRSGDYFNNIGLQLSKKKLDDALGRKMYLMEYFIYASTQEYLDYMEFLQPSLSLNQNKPLYSNFDNNAALGIFTFRSTCIVQKELDPVFINAFSSNANTCHYNFYDSNNKIQGCK